MPKIKKMLAFIAEDSPGDEGIVAALLGDTWMPIVGADMKRIDSLRLLAQKVSTAKGIKVTLAEFTERKDIETIMPDRK